MEKIILSGPLTSRIPIQSLCCFQCFLKNGNLVVRDQVNSSVVVWQSSDRPTDVLLAGGQLGFNPIALYFF
jgi:hypothetical protein